MTTREILKELEACGTEQNRKTYRRHGAGENLYGVSFANLGQLQKRIKTNHALALELWRTGNADARNLAALIADSAQLTDAQAEAWTHGLNRFHSYMVAKVVSQSPLARRKAEEWCAAPDEWLACTGWMIVSALATQDQELPDAFFEKLLRVIQRQIHRSPNWVRHGMNTALCGIGLRNATLEKPALAAAEKIGQVEVDMGDTSCQVPDAAAYIRKGAARKKSRGRAKAS